MRHGMFTVATGSFLLAMVACGSEDGSQFTDTNEPPPGNGVPNGASLSDLGPEGTASACVNQLSGAELTPANLVIMYDKSGSMGDLPDFDPALKWNPVNAGMKQFFADPYSSTLRASLQFFPQNDIDIPTACAFSYATPKVALTMASDPAFVSTLDATKPQGGTPTLPALNGAIAYAKSIQADRPEDKTVVVLVTDGEPGFFDPTKNAFVPGCPNNDIAHVAGAAREAFTSAKIPTFVIGVGPSLDKLNTVASAGGTGAAIMVNVNDPAKTKSQIVNALGQIRKSVVACDFSIPPAPEGEELDPFAVNVALTNADGSEKILGYSVECGSAEGWRYDNPASPKRIILCSAACDAARTSPTGKISLAFGCKTQIDLR
ncbi:MAG TPA: vWA domain-containing protein [Labilithrix sp.]|nr:vWA domain-containing protein [Labilithrix sp.]